MDDGSRYFSKRSIIELIGDFFQVRDVRYNYGKLYVRLEGKSSFYGHPNCMAVITKNKIIEHNGIIEIPVTVFRRVRRVKLGNWVLKRQSSFVKTDIDWASLDELKSFVKQAKESDAKVMTLFMHSYSLLKFDQDFTHFEPAWNDIEKLDKFLNFVANDQEIKVITMKEFYEMYQQDREQFIGSDYVPVVEYNEQFNPIKHGARGAKSIIRRLRHTDNRFTLRE